MVTQQIDRMTIFLSVVGLLFWAVLRHTSSHRDADSTAPSGVEAKPKSVAVYKLEKRILSSDAEPSEYLTLDRKRVVVNQVTRWRISEPLRFYITVRDEAGARARIDDLVFSELRREIAGRDFGDVIAEQREPAMEAVAARAREKAKQFGIDVVDVRIKRADLIQ